MSTISKISRSIDFPSRRPRIAVRARSLTLWGFRPVEIGLRRYQRQENRVGDGGYGRFSAGESDAGTADLVISAPVITALRIWPNRSVSVLGVCGIKIVLL